MRRRIVILCLLAGALLFGAFANQARANRALAESMDSPARSETPDSLYNAEKLDSLYRADSIARADSALARKKRPTSIDISRFSMQKRWRPTDEKAPSGLGWLVNDAYVYGYAGYLMKYVSQYGHGECRLVV